MTVAETQILDGKAIARDVRADVARLAARCAEAGARPGLAVVLVGDDPASQVYVRNKDRAAEEAGEPFRRDLELEALAEIVAGERLIHCHSYRQDEIFMLARLAQQFGFRIGTFQHVLEGYKVADELAAHGAGASTFSDWWGYKYEVVDAIPHNGTLMWDRGVVVSFNSDSSELARRLNLEAAKAVRYGGMPEEDALHLVTLNPAIQLGIENRVGSLEVGKDADFTIWSGHPLSTYSLCEQTWVDGRKYFDRAEDLAHREALRAEREALLAKAAASDDDDEEETEADEEDEETSAEPTVHEGHDTFCYHDDDDSACNRSLLRRQAR